MSRFILISLLTLFSVQAGFSAKTQLNIVPYPQVIDFQSGTLELNNGPVDINLGTKKGVDLEFEVQQAKQAFASTNPAGNKETVLWMGLFGEHKQFDELCKKHGITRDERIGNEGYVLLINKDLIAIAANSSAGIFYGIQTLKQIIMDKENENELPCVKITDWPQYRYRGMMDDISRGPVPTLAFMKNQIRRCAEMKINMLMYYIEHIVETESHGDFAPDEASITIPQWKMLSDYAKQYHIDLVGSFQSLSHGENILKHPNYKHLAVTYRMFNPLLPETYDFFRDVYSEMIPAFNSDFFAINCDESWDIGVGVTKETVDRIGLEQFFVDHVTKLDNIVKPFNKRSIVWADIPLEHPQILDMLPKDIILGAWEYSPLESYERYLKPLYDKGFDIIITPGVLNSTRLMPDLIMAHDNIKSFIEAGVDYNAMATLVTVWDDGGMALFSRDWYGVAYSAEKSWNVYGENRAPFDVRFNKTIYGMSNTALTDAIRVIEKLAYLPPTQELNENVLWQKIVPDSGRTLFLRTDYWDEISYICDQTDQALELADAERFAVDLDYFDFSVAQYRYLAQARKRMLQAAREYDKAYLIQDKDVFKAREHLLIAKDCIHNNIAQLSEIKAEYERLWLIENKVWWLDNVLTRYQSVLDAYQDVQRHLVNALAKLDVNQSLPVPADCRLDIVESNGDYFQEWMITGPFENNAGANGTDVDFLIETGGIENTEPIAGQTFPAPDGQPYRWSKYHSPEFGVIDITQKIGYAENAVAYANCRIYADKDQTVTASFASDDGVDVYLNGKQVYSKRGERKFSPDQDNVKLHLNKGTNYVILKLFQGTDDWRFSFQLLSENVKHHKYKYTLLNN